METIRKTGASIARIAVYLLAALVFLLPLIRLLLMGVTVENGYGLDNFAGLLYQERTRKAIVNTIIIAVSSTALAAGCGSGLAFLTAYCNIKRKGVIEFLVLLPFIIPSYIITLSWSSFFSSRGAFNGFLTSIGLPGVDIYTMGGIILVLGFCNIPIVYVNVVHMLRKIPRDMEWAARACGYSQRQAILKINLVSAAPAIAAGSVLAFLSAIDNFSVPAFLGISSGIPVLSTYIYENAIGFGPNAFPLAAALSMILSVIAAAGTMLEGFFVKRGASMDSIKEDYSVRIHLKNPLRLCLEWGTLVLLLILNIIPMAAMTASSFLKAYGLDFVPENLTLKNFAFVFHNRGVISAIHTSLTLAVVTTLVCIVAGTANPTQDDIREIKKEAADAAVSSGASPDTVEVHIEIDSQTGKVTAIATGSTEVKTTDLLKECDEAEALELATQDFGSKVSQIHLAEKTDKFYVYQGEREGKNPLRIVDKKGFIKVQCSNGMVVKCPVRDYKEVVETIWKEAAVFKTDSILRPDFFVCVGPRVGDYSAIDLEQIFLLMDLDLGDREPDEEIIIVGSVTEI